MKKRYISSSILVLVLGVFATNSHILYKKNYDNFSEVSYLEKNNKISSGTTLSEIIKDTFEVIEVNKTIARITFDTTNDEGMNFNLDDFFHNKNTFTKFILKDKSGTDIDVEYVEPDETSGLTTPYLSEIKKYDYNNRFKYEIDINNLNQSETYELTNILLLDKDLNGKPITPNLVNFKPTDSGGNDLIIETLYDGGILTDSFSIEETSWESSKIAFSWTENSFFSWKEMADTLVVNIEDSSGSSDITFSSSPIDGEYISSVSNSSIVLEGLEVNETYKVNTIKFSQESKDLSYSPKNSDGTDLEFTTKLPSNIGSTFDIDITSFTDVGFDFEIFFESKIDDIQLNNNSGSKIGDLTEISNSNLRYKYKVSGLEEHTRYKISNIIINGVSYNFNPDDHDPADSNVVYDIFTMSSASSKKEIENSVKFETSSNKKDGFLFNFKYDANIMNVDIDIFDSKGTRPDNFEINEINNSLLSEKEMKTRTFEVSGLNNGDEYTLKSLIINNEQFDFDETKLTVGEEGNLPKEKETSFFLIVSISTLIVVLITVTSTYFFKKSRKK